jgi:L-ascorbate metabolism protein UlaG (beta-lactamase superfamily)
VIDPYLTGNDRAPIDVDELPDPDLILVSHGGFDHVGDAFELTRRSGALLLASADVALAARATGLETVFPMVSGAWREHGRFRVQAVEARHVSITPLRDGGFVSGQPLGFVIWPTVDETTAIYHSGDTSLFSDMALIGRLYSPTVALVCVGGPLDLPQEMSPDEAAMAIELLRVPAAIPMHWVPGQGDPEAFQAAVAERCPQTLVKVMEPGETVSLPMNLE